MDAPPTIVVTGASRGIGLAVARHLVQWQARVVLAGRHATPLTEAARGIDSSGDRTLAKACDVSDPEGCRQLIAAARKRFGPISALVNNAGDVHPLAGVAVVDTTRWAQALAVNLMGPLYLIQAALPDLRKTAGRIVNVSSGAARTPIAAASAYCAAKAGLNQLTAVVAAEEPMVTAVAIRPGVVDTAMQGVLREDGPAAMPGNQADYYLDLHRHHRLEPPDVPGRAIAWLAMAAPVEWSGRFISYDDPDVTSHTAAFASDQSAL